MDLFDVLMQFGVITAALVTYLMVFRKPSKTNGNYRQPGWNYPLKLLFARYAVRRWKSQLPDAPASEDPQKGLTEGWDAFSFRTTAPDGTSLLIGIRKLCGRKPLAEILLHVKLPDGTTYKLARHPDTAVGAWESGADEWSAGGLKLQVLERGRRLRVLFNGLLIRAGDNTTRHCKLNLIWASASTTVRYPQDWSSELAAEALALDPWRDDNWHSMLGKWEDGSWHQWGVLQGRFESFDDEGGVEASWYLQTRGVRERAWSPHGYQGVRRWLSIAAAASDGTMLHLRALSYNNVLTQCMHGSVRFPSYAVESITSTDLAMSDFCESSEGIPQVYTLNVSTKNRQFKLVLRINADGGQLFSGVPYEQEIMYRTMAVAIDDYHGAGVLELGYQPTEIKEPAVRLSPPRILKWLTEKEAGVVGYCLPFEAKVAACSNYVGGKGASLALLASMQKEEGYRVPPGYCLTTKALEKHLETNPKLREAIMEIEAANEDYNEANFKDKCAKAANLFGVTEITGDLKDDILAHLKDLRQKAAEQKLGDELRFAVRSSAVGEDSEALSAAGQNETILGCVSDADVLLGVQKCWGSMFAFTSAYYRRQNGQVCLCGGGVVVQALVRPRVAGVMFTRHPQAGDPSRLLITANYGLGESVVSGAVEPDTVIVSRSEDGQVKIIKMEVGAKAQRVLPGGQGVAMEEVPEAERKVACLSEAEALRLAQLGVAQEELWGAGRDIEWAILENEIFLLQARPITSLERWTEEELLHELDFPIMADDELITFANTGEVMPKATTPLSYDMVTEPLGRGMLDIMKSNVPEGYDDSVGLTHNRCALLLYNSTYRRMPKEIDMNIRMLEMAVHGHKVADDQILSTALHRRYTPIRDKLFTFKMLVTTLLTSKRKMNDSIKFSNKMNVDVHSDNPLDLLKAITDNKPTMERLSVNHGSTSAASSIAQFIAMTVLLEGNADFSPEHCTEIGTLLSSGDVLSSEVPLGIAKLSREIEKSGRAEEFKAQDPKAAMEWLHKNLPTVYQEVQEFLKHHGHRAIMEFDLVTKPWAVLPEDLMKLLQNMRAVDEEIKENKSNAEIIASLKTPKKPNTRKALRWILPLCHRAVQHREGTKAHLILGVHKLRLIALRLGKLLVRQWYLPDPDLVFFFRENELRTYIETRDPALLKKAIQRQQYYPAWCKLKFAELNTGWVKPLQSAGPLVSAADVKLQATSVCGGEVVARACVVKDLSEIDQLQQGDVLITHATDIGWSPYFPLLTGIVTELGGLISHGAVIAREYGLPCIVGAMDATDIFKTGDLVRLSGSKGLIERVQLQEKQNNEGS